MDDVPAVTELLAAWERAEPVDNSYTETEIREEFAAPTAALDGGGVAVLADGRLVGYGLLHVIVREPEWVAFSDGGVHPEWHRRGIGRRILEHQVEQAGRLRGAQAPDHPGELRVGVAEARVGTRLALESVGFATERYFFRMRADLRGPAWAPVDAPSGVRIREYRTEDEEAVRLASNAAFADHWGSAPRDPDVWRAEYPGASSFRPAASFVAEGTADHGAEGTADGAEGADHGAQGTADGAERTDHGAQGTADPGGGIVGFVLAAEHEADTAQRGHRTGYVSRVGTTRAARGRGIGTALVSRSLVAMRAQGFAEAELHVDAQSPTGAGRLYSRLGFGVVDRDRLLTRVL